MTTKPKGFDALKALCGKARLMSDGGTDFVFLPDLRIWTNSTTIAMDALLCFQAHSGYATRLFLEKAIANKASNWTTHSIMGRLWHSWSWGGVAASLPLPDMLANHLRALR